MPALLLLILLTWGPMLSAAENVTPEGGFSLDARGTESHEFSKLLGKAERNFYQLTRFPESDAPPIHVHLGPKNCSPVLAVDALESGIPSISLTIPADLNNPESLSFLSAALLLREYYGKTAPVPGSRVPQYPDWTLHGLGFLIAGRGNGESSLSSGGETPVLTDFLNQRVPSSETVLLRNSYDLTAAELVRAGLFTDSGRASFRKWVGSYDPSRSTQAQMPWVDGWEMHPVERRWILGLQTDRQESEPASAKIFGPAESLEAYHHLMAEYWIGNASLTDLHKARGGDFLLKKLSERLVAQRLQANPLVAPLIDHTLELIRKVPHLSTEKVRSREDVLRAEAQAIGKRIAAIGDFMNWYEATRVNKASGIFDSYLTSPAPSVKKGPVGQCLDAVEERGW